MDFRHVSIDRLDWRASGTKLKCVYGGGKALFQLPRLRARITPVPRFPGAIELAFTKGIPGALTDFFERVRESAEWHMNPAPEQRYLDPLRKLTAFNDTLAFDADGTLLTKCMQTLGPHASVSCLVSLDGAWSSDTYWGLRLKLVQLKVHEEELETNKTETDRAAVVFFEDGKPLKKRMFLDDDEDDEEPRKKRTVCFLADDEDD